MAWSSAPYRFEAIGTQWQIDLSDGLLASKKAEIFRLITDRIKVFDQHYSRFRKDSLVTVMSEKAGVYTLPPDAEPMFLLYEDLYRRTNGLMTPLIGTVLSAAGYDAEYSLQTKKMVTPPPLETVMTRNGLELILHQPVLFDFGAAGKGYLIDIIANILRSKNIESFCVDAGGDMAYYTNSKEGLRVGLEDPTNTEKIIGVATILNQSLCGSAGNRRVWGSFHHIINPSTLTSPRHIAALWVIAPTTLIADALSTALFFVDPENLLPIYQFEYLLVMNDFSIRRSKNFPIELFM